MTNKDVVRVGDVWMSPRRRLFKVLRFDGDDHCVLWNEAFEKEEGATPSRIRPENGWIRVTRGPVPGQAEPS